MKKESRVEPKYPPLDHLRMFREAVEIVRNGAQSAETQIESRTGLAVVMEERQLTTNRSSFRLVMASLEEHFGGVWLFSRGKPLEITSNGNDIYALACQMLDLHDAHFKRIDTSCELLSIGVTYSALAILLAPFFTAWLDKREKKRIEQLDKLSDFKQSEKQAPSKRKKQVAAPTEQVERPLRLNFFEYTFAEIARDLRNDTVCLGITGRVSNPIASEVVGLECVPLGNGVEMGLYESADVKKKSKVDTVEDLAHMPLCLTRSDTKKDFFDTLVPAPGVERMIVSTYEAAIAFIQRGHFAGFLPAFAPIVSNPLITRVETKLKLPKREVQAWTRIGESRSTVLALKKDILAHFEDENAG